MYSPVRQVSQSPHSYRHDDNIYTSRSRHEHVMQRIQTFHHQYTNLITNRWGHFANLYKHKPRIPIKKQEACLRRKPHEHQLLGNKPLGSSSIKRKVGKAVSTSSNFLFHQRCTIAFYTYIYKHKPRIPLKKQEACLRRKPHEHQILGDKPPVFILY